ncbi:MAG: HAMP domain-containing histidine kinase [Deltaproteobacteria bacterium]|nr:HAMP domain-containing histidine kinase [Deltaproteobacteria bacterium]
MGRHGHLHERHPHHRRARLFWRVYLNGLLLLLLVAVGLAAVGWASGGGSPPGRPERTAELAARLFEADLSDPARLKAALVRAQETFGVDVTAWGPEGVMASNVEPPIPSLSAQDQRRLAGGAIRVRGRHWTFAAALARPESYLVVRSAWRPFAWEKAAAFAGAVLLAVALASIPLAHAIARPIERLTRAARQLGAGDLTARAGGPGRGEVGELSRAFDEMAERLERQVKAERELLANVSHELRTPLSRIRVALELAAQGDHEASRRYLGEIDADLGELERLLEDVLTAARLQAGQGAELPLHPEPLAAEELVRRAAERFRAAWPGRALEVRSEGALPELRADPALLRRALDNLLDNARKYSEAPAPVVLAARADGGALLLEVRDQGIGIDAADMPRLFTPFFRTDRSRARGTGGVGLGLLLARRIVEAHGGSVAVESAPGQGTTVRLRIPAAGSEAGGAG